MCGITGYLTADKIDHRFVLDRMVARLTHRGPDDSGIWVDEDAGVAIGHRRLAVIDLSMAGHQPMSSASGRFVIAYNGEIYNHEEMRRRLEASESAPVWRGHADTETLLAAVEAWGLEATLKASRGMFAIALWDREKRELTLARDRLGEKPLYYGIQRNCLIFGSELKSLREHPLFQSELNRGAVSLFLRYGAIPSPYSIYEGIHKLTPGTYLNVKMDQVQLTRQHLEPVPFWSITDVVRQGLDTPFDGTLKEAGDNLERLLAETTKQQMLSDVPLGAFLSGGIDSSAIVALMQSQSSRPVKTFTIGFKEAAYSEATHAAEVARHLGTDHTEMILGSDDALSLIPNLSEIWCEPFGDSSQLPTLLVSRLARHDVTVALSGDGGDEIFGGYNRHIAGPAIWRHLRRIPLGARSIGARLLAGPKQESWDRLYGLVKPLVPSRYRVSMPGFKMHKLASVIAQPNIEALYRGLVSHWQDPRQVVLGASDLETTLDYATDPPEAADLEHWMMLLDTLTYLPDDILVKVDRAAMSTSLETRVPFLDHRVVEFAWTLPLQMKISDGRGKLALREVLYRYVPKEIVERPKRGFEIPIADWLCGTLRPWAEALLNENRLRNEGVFDPVPIRRMWLEHLSGARNWQNQLWDILMFQEWYASQH